MKIGMYTEEEIFEEIANGFLGRSMYDAIFDKIHALITENEQLQQERNNYKEKYNKALQLLTEYNLPCEIDNFNTKEENLDYCSRNCSVDEKTYIKCWDRFIEQSLKEVE